MAASNVSFSGSVPSNYDQYLGPLLFEPYAAELITRIPNNNISAVLELACGTGRVTKHLAEKLPASISFIASDLNPDMIAVAKKKIAANNIEWRTVDMLNIPFEDESFDLMVCQFGLMFVPDKEKAFQEIRRVLRKNGEFIFSTWDQMKNNPVTLLVEQTVNSFFPSNPIPFYQTPYSYYQVDEIEQLLKSVGFRNISISPIEKIGTSTAKDAAMGWIEGNPVHGFIFERDPQLVNTIKQKVEEVLRTQFGDPLRSPLRAWIMESFK